MEIQKSYYMRVTAMAKQAIYSGLLTRETMNGDQGYRVKLSYGVFSIAPKVTQSGRYWYAYKRSSGRLFKVYIGKGGEVTKDMVHKATMALIAKVRAETGREHIRDNRARQVTQRARGQLISRSAARLAEINDKADRCAAGEVFTMAGHTITYDRIEPGMDKLIALIDDTARELGGDVLKFYMSLPDDAYYRLEHEIANASAER
jgi:hypothetical protein